MFKITLRQFLVALAFLATSAVATAQSWPPAGMLGNGNAGNPYQITTAAHLKALADYVNAPNVTFNRYYKLMNDIDMSIYPNWYPIGDGLICSGYACAYFQGVFDGNYKVIRNLTVNNPSGFAGLFGVINSAGNNSGVVKNLGIENCNINGDYAGGLAGQIVNSTAVISGCYVTGSVNSGGTYAGGLAGFSNAPISNCYTTCKVSGNSYAGGLVGFIYSTISYCYATGSVSSNNSAGGLVGGYYGGTIRNCIAANDTIIITNNTNNINRINGFNGQTFQNNYALNSMVVQNSNGNIPITPDLNTKAGMDISMSNLQNFSFYAAAGNWYNNQAWNITSPSGIWDICDGKTLPWLRWQGISYIDTFSITATAIGNGNISPIGTVRVIENTNQTFIFSANNCYNKIDSLWIDGVYAPDSIFKGCYTFNNVAANHTIKVSFKLLPDTVIIYDAICYGANYTQNGFNITNATTDSVYFNNDFYTNGCDSVTRLELRVGTFIFTPILADICENATYFFKNEDLNVSGIYYDTLQAIFGCDSIIELTLTVHFIDTTKMSIDICEGESYDFFGRTLTEEGIYYETLQTIHGCDSIIELTLTVTNVGIVGANGIRPIQIYPNPAFTQLHVKLDTQETVIYSIYNVVGQIILQGKIQDNSSINIESLTSGMYYLKVAGKTVKFVKE